MIYTCPSGVNIGANLSNMINFPMCYMWSFVIFGPDCVVHKKDAHCFIRQVLLQVPDAASLIMADVHDQGMHKYITPRLPDKFNAKLGIREREITCTVSKGKKYKNLNSGNYVREVRIDFTDGWTAGVAEL